MMSTANLAALSSGTSCIYTIMNFLHGVFW